MYYLYVYMILYMYVYIYMHTVFALLLCLNVTCIISAVTLYLCGTGGLAIGRNEKRGNQHLM